MKGTVESLRRIKADDCKTMSRFDGLIRKLSKSKWQVEQESKRRNPCLPGLKRPEAEGFHNGKFAIFSVYLEITGMRLLVRSVDKSCEDHLLWLGIVADCLYLIENPPEYMKNVNILNSIKEYQWYHCRWDSFRAWAIPWGEFARWLPDALAPQVVAQTLMRDSSVILWSSDSLSSGFYGMAAQSTCLICCQNFASS